jgi:hypothetical protein
MNDTIGEIYGPGSGLMPGSVLEERMNIPGSI